MNMLFYSCTTQSVTKIFSNRMLKFRATCWVEIKQLKVMNVFMRAHTPHSITMNYVAYDQ